MIEKTTVEEPQGEKVVIAEQTSVSPFDLPGKWYALHTQSGHEKKVKRNIEQRSISTNTEHKVFEVVIPMEEVTVFSGGTKKIVEKKMFPGYVLVRCHLDEDAFFAIRQAPGVVSFSSQTQTPVPLSRFEVEKFLGTGDQQDAAANEEALTASLGWNEGDSVNIRSGPFKDFSGTIAEIFEDKMEVKVLVDVFNRETPVQLAFKDIQLAD